MFVTLDPVHFDGILRLASRIRPAVDERDHQAFAETVWEEFLDPLRHDGIDVIEPIEQRRRRTVDSETIALEDDPFPTRHGLDSGTINPTTFKNGLVVDVAQAAMSAVPSDLQLHRARTIVKTVHASDITVDVDQDDWLGDDEGYCRQRLLQVPRVDRFEQRVVHVLALYLAESEHALTQADVVEDLLVLDGPIYPKGLLEWRGRDARLGDLLAESEKPRTVVANYLRLVERFVDREVPLVGFVKSPGERTITRAVRSTEGNAPWMNDTAFFERILSGANEDLAITNWFISRGGADRIVSRDGDVLGLERRLDARAYEVAFCVIFDRREGHLFRIETPFAFAQNAEFREKIVRQMLSGIASERGPPPVVAKADELARISLDEKATLHDALEREFDADRDRSYNEARWGLEFEGT